MSIASRYQSCAKLRRESKCALDSVRAAARGLRREPFALFIAVIVLIAVPGRAHEKPVPVQNPADVQEMERQAVREAYAGHFDAADQLLRRAASTSRDPTVAQMANWSSSFESQIQAFANIRRKQYDELVSQSKLLQQHGVFDYAMTIAARAYLISDDKESFIKQPWVIQLVKDSSQRSAEEIQAERWIKALRIISNLATIEPWEPKWKNSIKLVTGRIRLLSMYAPAALTAMRQTDLKDREEAEQLLDRSGTSPRADRAVPVDNLVNDVCKFDGRKLDWHDSLRGVRQEMLWEALIDVHENYYRTIDYKVMAIAGLRKLQSIAKTKGLEKSFPKLADADRRAAFLNSCDEAIARNANARADGEKEALRNTLTDLTTFNHDSVDLPPAVLVSTFAEGVFEELDPLTYMIWPNDLAEFGQRGKHVGVGIQTQSDPDGRIRVVSVSEDTPAYNAGIRAGDVITQIAGKPTNGISNDQAVLQITGPAGKAIKLTVAGDPGATRDVSLIREVVAAPSVKGFGRTTDGGWDFVVDPQLKIGYVRITHFPSETARDLSRALDEMNRQHVRAVIADIRANPGGVLTSVSDVADRFVDHGVIVSVRPERGTANPPTIVEAKPDEEVKKLPLVMLVNQHSSGGSEVLGGALKEQHRAILVGEQTSGMGSVQMLYPVDDRSAFLRVTTGLEYLPSGRCIERQENKREWGVTPDLMVLLTPEQLRIAMKARQDLDVLGNEQVAAGRPLDGAYLSEAAVKKRDCLTSDIQLSAALLLLRLQLSTER